MICWPEEFWNANWFVLNFFRILSVRWIQSYKYCKYKISLELFFIVKKENHSFMRFDYLLSLTCRKRKRATKFTMPGVHQPFITLSFIINETWLVLPSKSWLFVVGCSHISCYISFQKHMRPQTRSKTWKKNPPFSGIK